jgi:hypothetical protein
VWWKCTDVLEQSNARFFDPEGGGIKFLYIICKLLFDCAFTSQEVILMLKLE